MKISIFYFSGTGNTWLVANELEAALKAQGADATALSIEDYSIADKSVLKKMVDGSDKVIIGFPIYGSAAPRTMIDFINTFPKTTLKKGLSIFTTVALDSGDGPIHYRDILVDKGYVFETGMEFKTSNNICIPGFPKVLKVGDDAKVNRKNANAKKRADKMAEAILKGKNIVQGDSVFAIYLGGTQRKYIDKYIKKINDALYVEHDKCINCSRCIKMCPVDNISRIDGKIVIGDNCAVCMRCYHFCPPNAINITEASLDTKKWPRFKGPTSEYIKTLL